MGIWSPRTKMKDLLRLSMMRTRLSEPLVPEDGTKALSSIPLVTLIPAPKSLLAPAHVMPSVISIEGTTCVLYDSVPETLQGNPCIENLHFPRASSTATVRICGPLSSMKRKSAQHLSTGEREARESQRNSGYQKLNLLERHGVSYDYQAVYHSKKEFRHPQNIPFRLCVRGITYSLLSPDV